MNKNIIKNHSYLSEDFLEALQTAVRERGGQAAVAYESGVSQPQVSRILRGHDAYISTLVRLVGSLGGFLCRIEEKAVNLVAEEPKTYTEELLKIRTRLTQEMEQVAECKAQLLDQQRQILAALVIICREYGLTEAQANAVQLAVFTYPAILEGQHKVGYAGADLPDADSGS